MSAPLDAWNFLPKKSGLNQTFFKNAYIVELMAARGLFYFPYLFIFHKTIFHKTIDFIYQFHGCYW